MRPPRARAPTPTRKPNAAQHGAELALFLRAREHQFSYDQSAYPDTDRWGNAALKNLKRRFGGTTHLKLNCWGLVFYTHHRTGNLAKRALEARASACNKAVQAIDNSLQRAELRLQHLRQDLVGNAPSSRARSASRRIASRR